MLRRGMRERGRENAPVLELYGLNVEVHRTLDIDCFDVSMTDRY